MLKFKNKEKNNSSSNLFNQLERKGIQSKKIKINNKTNAQKYLLAIGQASLYMFSKTTIFK